MDGRGHPENYPTSRVGHSIGSWDGDTLVIDTRLLTETLPGRWPRTENTRIIERVSLAKRADITAPASGFIITPPVGDDVLVFDITVSDPTLYAEVRNITMYYQRIEDDAILEYDCAVDLWLQALE